MTSHWVAKTQTNESRAIPNLCNYAFDAMRSKAGADGYQPGLTVRTRQTESRIRIEVGDNGPGIPIEIQEKILQPFFTTKKGTGLGLSITHDIVKTHGVPWR